MFSSCTFGVCNIGDPARTIGAFICGIPLSIVGILWYCWNDRNCWCLVRKLCQCAKLYTQSNSVVVDLNIHTHPKEGYWKFHEEGGSKAKICKWKCEPKINGISRIIGKGGKSKNPPWEGMDIFWKNTFLDIFGLIAEN